MANLFINEYNPIITEELTSLGVDVKKTEKHAGIVFL